MTGLADDGTHDRSLRQLALGHEGKWTGYGSEKCHHVEVAGVIRHEHGRVAQMLEALGSQRAAGEAENDPAPGARAAICGLRAPGQKDEHP